MDDRYLLLLGEIKGGVDAVNKRLDGIESRLGEHGRRIGVIENNHANARGKMSVISIAVSAIISLAVAILSKVFASR